MKSYTKKEMAEWRFSDEAVGYMVMEARQDDGFHVPSFPTQFYYFVGLYKRAKIEPTKRWEDWTWEVFVVVE